MYLLGTAAERTLFLGGGSLFFFHFQRVLIQLYLYTILVHNNDYI